MRSPREAHKRELQQNESFKEIFFNFFFLAQAPNAFMIYFDLHSFDRAIFRA